MKCQIWNQPINPKNFYTKVSGWAKKREAGGINGLRKIEYEKEMACSYCVEYGKNQKLL